MVRMTGLEPARRSTRSVSYTHLDVYKRQIPSNGNDWKIVNGTSPVPGGISTNI